MPSKPGPTPELSKEAKRVRYLNQCFKAAAWWLIFLGFFYLITGPRISYSLRVRYDGAMAPLLRILGMAYLIIAVYLRRAANEPENQVMAVDLLCLFMWMQTMVFMGTKISSEPVFGGEWLITAVNLGFGVCLFLWRTKSTAVPEGTPGAADAKVAAKEVMGKLKELLEEKKRLRPMPTGSDAGEVKKRVSEAAPHMD